MSFVISALAMQSGLLQVSLQPLEWLAGSCWRGTMTGGQQSDTHCFTPMLGGAFLRDVHIVEGGTTPRSGETIYRLDRSTGEIWFDQFASDGDHGSGSVWPVDDGLEFPAYNLHDGIGVTETRGRWTRDGTNAYFVLTEQLEGETWREVARTRMVRIGPAPAR